MKIVPLLIAGIFFSNICLAEQKDTEQLFVKKMAEVLYNNQSDESWPGFNINVTPTILYLSNLHTYAFSFVPHNPHWQQLPDIVNPTFYLDRDEYNINNLPWGYGVLIDEQPSYLFKYDDILSLEENVFIILHERFHMFQFETFPLEEFGTYTGFNQLESVTLSYLEDEALKNYLLTSDTNAIKDFVAINQYRQQLIGIESSEYESRKEKMEGLADYFAWSMMNLDAKERNNKLISTYQNKCTLDNLIKCQLHERYYFSGSALGIVLDQLSPSLWKKEFIENKISLRKQLAKFFPMNVSEIQQQIENAKLRYHFDEIKPPVEKALLDYKNDLETELNTYTQMEGIPLSMKKTPCNLFGMLRVEKEYWIDSGASFQKEKTGDSMCQDQSIMVNYHRLPFDFVSKEYRHEFKIPAATKINVDGNEMTAQAFFDKGQAVQFNHLMINSSFVEIRVERQGEILAQDKRIVLQFADE